MKKYRRAVRACLENLEIQLNVIGYPEADTCRELLHHAKKAGSRELEGLAAYYTALNRLDEGEQVQAVHGLTDAIRCLENTENCAKLADSYIALGMIAHSENNLVLAIENYNSALSYCKGGELEYERVYAEGNIAGAYYRMGAFDTASGFYEKCVKEYRGLKEENQRNEWNYLLILAAYGNCLMAQQKHENAQKIESEIWEMLYYHPAMGVPKLAVYTFFAVMRQYSRETEKADEYADVAIRDLKEQTVSLTGHDNILDLLNYLVNTNDASRLKDVLDFLEGRENAAGNEGFHLQLLLMRLQNCVQDMPREEYLLCARRFFVLRQEYEEKENRQIIKTVELRNRLREMRRRQQEITMQNEELLQKSLHDEVSGLPNRRYLMTRAEEMLREAERNTVPFGVVMADLDYFKEYNDAYGHQAGDNCIHAVATVLARVAQDGGFAARYGGDEFILLFEGKGAEEMTTILESIREGVTALRIPHEKTKEAYATVTLGCVNRAPGAGSRLWDYLSAADQALYKVKTHSRNGYYLVP